MSTLTMSPTASLALRFLGDKEARRLRMIAGEVVLGMPAEPQGRSAIGGRGFTIGIPHLDGALGRVRWPGHPRLPESSRGQWASAPSTTVGGFGPNRMPSDHGSGSSLYRCRTWASPCSGIAQVTYGCAH